MPIMYEWVMETVTADDHEDIENVDHQQDVDDYSDDKLAKAMSGEQFDDELIGRVFCRLALVKKSLDEVGDLKWMDYAYLREDGTLAPGDETGFRAPKTYQKALAAKINRYV